MHGPISALLLVALTLPMAPAPAAAQTLADSTVLAARGLDGSGADGAGRTYSGNAGELQVEAPRHDDPDIDIDGRLDDEAWQRAAILRGFTQYEPLEGAPASQATQIRVLYSGDAIYFGVRARDSEPDQIVARLGERDRSAFGDDFVRISLDTFDDQRQAYVFYVNPLGVQADGLWIEGKQTRFGVPIDFNPDFIWESGGRVTATGWEAEIRIPYVSLRFPEAGVQSWGMNVAREVRRTGFSQSWAPLTRNVTSTLAQSGRLVNLRELRPRRLVELNPVVTGTRRGTLDDAGQFGRGGLDSEVGLNARYGVTRNLVLDATLNPDFSQVEADADRITLNERFSAKKIAKRSFFLEGTEVFNSFQRLVHTRQIADPIAGSKLTGKVGSFNFGYLGAVDQSPSSLLDEDGDAVFNLVRARRDIGAGSTVGLLYTDRTRTSGGGFNRVLSGDLRLLFGGSYSLSTQLTGSWDKEDDTGGDAALKPMVSLELRKSGRTFEFQAKFEDVHPDFRTRSGFINRVGDTELKGQAAWSHFGESGALLERFRLLLESNNFLRHDDLWRGVSPFEREIQLTPTLSFRGGRSLTIIGRVGYFRFRAEDYDRYAVGGAAGETQPFVLSEPLSNMWAVGFLPRVRITDELNVNGSVFLREIPIFSEAAQGFEVQARPRVTVKPSRSLEIELSHTFSRLRRSADDSEFSTTNISRLKTQYQFSRALFARVIAQYNIQKRSALRDSTTGLPILVDGEAVDAAEGGTFLGQFLLSYEPSPGTIFFVGYSRLEEGEHGYDLSRMRPTEDGLFIKLSYLWRM